MSDEKEKVEVRIVLPRNVLTDPETDEQASEEFEPTLVQGLMHAGQYRERSLGQNERYAAEKLYALSEKLCGMNPDEQRYGALGGEFGYGQDFKNDTFEMFPFYWGDCTCGYAEAEEEWSATHVHTQECFRSRYEREEGLAALHAGGKYEPGVSEHMTAWSKANGYEEAPNGMAVYCDCPHGKAWHEWWTTHWHKSDCPIERPNFKCGDIEICWYKYIGRGMSVNRSVTKPELKEMFRRCFASLENTA